MPRVNGVYTLPPAYRANPGEDILSTTHNTPLLDIENEFNQPVTLSRGGTGAADATAARANLGLIDQTTLSDTTTGAYLTTGSFGLGGLRALTNADDLNDTNSVLGFWSYLQNNAPLNGPVSPFGAAVSAYSGVTMPVTGSTGSVQFAQSNIRADETYIRSPAGAGMTSWRRLITREGAAGLLSDGHLFEQGQNANGSYLKIAGAGTQAFIFCFHTISVTAAAAEQWTYPVALTQVLGLSVSSSITSASGRIPTSFGIGVASYFINVRDTSDSPADGTVRAMVFGLGDA